MHSPINPLLLACIVILCLAVTSTNAQAFSKIVGKSNTQKSEFTYEDVASGNVELADLSDSVLEGICTTRGFELIEKDSTAPEFSHEEYVEAARQCIELEKELIKLSEENPELYQELEAAQVAEALDDGEVMDLDQLLTDADSVSLSSTSDDAVDPEATPSTAIGDPNKANILNPAGISTNEFLTELKEKVRSDAATVLSLIPKSLRAPVKGTIIKAMKVTKGVMLMVGKQAKHYAKILNSKLNDLNNNK